MSSSPDSIVAPAVNGSKPNISSTPSAGDADCDSLGERLSTRQLAALQAITSGKNLAAAAESSGVPRRTIYNWLATDPHFRAAYNAWKRELMEFGRGRLLKMTESALDSLRAAIEKGDGRLALTLLKDIGMLAPETPGLTDPELVKAEMILDRRRDRIEVAEQEKRANSLAYGLAGEKLAKLENQERMEADAGNKPPQ